MLCFALLGASCAAGQHLPGFMWNRRADFVPGSAPGANFNAGNPSPDALGAPVWTCEFALGGEGLDGQPRWYTRPTALLSWDPLFDGFGAWTAGDDTPPAIHRDFALHFRASADTLSRAPILRWRNPLSSSATIDIEGMLRVTWGGVLNTSDAHVDVVIVQFSSAGAATTLFQTTVTKPMPNDQIESVPVDIALVGVPVAPGDSIVYSLRARQTAADPTHYVGVLDEALVFTLRSIASCPADINGDNVVNFADLNAVLGQFNQPCP